MKYLILLLAMLATVAEAKEPARPCLRFNGSKTQKLHQQGETYVKLTFETRCYVEIRPPWGSPAVEFQNTDGLQATGPHAEQPGSENEISVFFTVKASKDAALGKQKLHGSIHYKDIVSGSYSDETLEFDVPVKVLRPLPMDTFAYDHPVWDKALLPFEVIGIIVVAIPVCLFLFITTGHGCLE